MTSSQPRMLCWTSSSRGWGAKRPEAPVNMVPPTLGTHGGRDVSKRRAKSRGFRATHSTALCGTVGAATHSH